MTYQYLLAIAAIICYWTECIVMVYLHPWSVDHFVKFEAINSYLPFNMLMFLSLYYITVILLYKYWILICYIHLKQQAVNKSCAVGTFSYSWLILI